MEKIVKDTVSIFENIPLRDTPTDPGELPEALAVIVVDYDGVNPSKLVTGKMAPEQQKPVYYENFILRICELYGKRFIGR